MCLFHPSHPRGGHPPHSNLVRGKLTSPTPTLQETGPTVLRPIREDEVMNEFVSVSRPETDKILQQAKRSLHGPQSAFYHDRILRVITASEFKDSAFFFKVILKSLQYRD